MPVRTLISGFALLAIFGCSETAYDVYLQGAKIEGEAQRGPCKPKVVGGAQPSILSGDAVATCIRETEKALARYDKAAEMGYRDPEFQRMRERTRASLERLRGMLKMVRAMEREQQGVPPTENDPLGRGPAGGSPPEPAPVESTL